MNRLAKGAQKTTPYMRLVATETVINGVTVKTYEPDEIVEDTAQVVTWFEPDLKSGDCIRILTTGVDYEIIGEPENIELRSQDMTFKVRRIKGGA